MQSSRLPRFARAPMVAALQITARDREIIWLVYQHRFLRSSHIILLVNGSAQQILRRLKLLYHYGYLERPRSQLDYYYKKASRHIVYGLGNKAGALLKTELGPGFQWIRWSEKNRAVGRMFLEHALLVSDVMVTLELACRRSGEVRLIVERELGGAAAESAKRSLFRWKVNIDRGVKLGVVPDRVFALEYSNQSGTSERAYFFLEADRGTMPVMRKGLSQTSFYRKLLAYEATWTQNLHRTRLGFHRFRMLTIATSEGRVQSLVHACSQLKRGHGLFLFTDRTALAKPHDIMSHIWQTGRQGKTSTLLN